MTPRCYTCHHCHRLVQSQGKGLPMIVCFCNLHKRPTGQLTKACKEYEEAHSG